jgi:hypothetical protein
MGYAEDIVSCFWEIKCKKMLLVRRGYTSILYQEGQLARLNPISGEDSGHTSILVRREQ